MEPHTIVVDGYNVIRNTPGLAAAEAKSLQSGHEALITLLTARYRHTPHRVIVVFDGDGPAESSYPLSRLSRSQVIFTRRGESADAVIQRLAQVERDRGAQVTVVSNDLEVRAGATTSGGYAARVEDLTQRLNEPGKYQRRMAQHRTFVRSQWEARDEDTSAHPRAGNPKRASRRRRGGRMEPPL